MRILYVIPAYFPAIRYGGPIFCVHGAASALVRRGHAVDVFTTNVDGPGVSPVPVGVPCELDGVRVWYFECGVPRRLCRSPSMGRALRERVRDYDIVHLNSVFLWPPAAAAREARRANVPYVLSPHGMLVKDLVRRKNWAVKTAWLSLVDRRMIEGASALHLMSDLERREVERFGFSLPHIFIVPNGTELPSGRLCEKRDAAHLVYLGRINWKKGLDRLLPAMSAVPDARLTIAGNDEEGYQRELQALAHRVGVAERVDFVGPVYGEDKTKLLSRATLFVLPSYSENFGVVVLEAMACACPVVVTRDIGAGELVQRAGAGVVVSGEVSELSQTLRELLRDAEGLRKMGEAGRQAVISSYTYDAVAAHLESEYENVLSSAVRDGQ